MKKGIIFILFVVYFCALISAPGTTPQPYILHIPSNPIIEEPIKFYFQNNLGQAVSIVQFLVYDSAGKSVYGSAPINLTIAVGEKILVFEWDQKGNTESFQGQVPEGGYTAKIKYALPGIEEASYIGKYFAIGNQTETCVDTDNGASQYTYGKVKYYQENGEHILSDQCLDDKKLSEAICNDNKIGESKIIECEGICKEGICIKSENVCQDSDNGVNFYEKGHLTYPAQNADYYDFCTDLKTTDATGGFNYAKEGKILKEFYCKEGNYQYKFYECEGICVDGKCVKAEIIKPEEDKEVEIPEEKEDLKYVCSGCEFDNKCFPYGYRKEGKYCTDNNNEFVYQKLEESSCENNFECSSNVCLDSKCVSGSLIAKILSWLKKFFGAN